MILMYSFRLSFQRWGKGKLDLIFFCILFPASSYRSSGKVGLRCHVRCLQVPEVIGTGGERMEGGRWWEVILALEDAMECGVLSWPDLDVGKG